MDRPDLGKKLGFKIWYESLAERTRELTEWAFMNYGCEEPWDAPLSPEDEPARRQIRLYDRLARLVSLEDREVLEVGCGRGGGASYLARYHHPRRYVAGDYSTKVLGFASTLHAEVERLSFAQVDADALAFEDASFDVVLSVEASHCFGSMPRFLAGARRVLRPGGALLLADFRAPAALEQLLGEFVAAGFTPGTPDDITPAVLAALDLDAPRKDAWIDANLPPGLREEFSAFAARAGSPMYEAFASGQQIYFCITARS